MSHTVRVNLHSHSHFSDGDLSPEALAGILAEAGIRAASLTDHDSILGLEAFASTLARKGIGTVSGVELTAASPLGGECHILGYGFDPHHPALQEHLKLVSGAGKNRGRGSGSLSQPGSRTGGLPEYRPAAVTVPAAQVISVVHQAGGTAFLAHPVIPGQPWDRPSLVRLIQSLKNLGLDGIEAFYEEYPESLRHELAVLAKDFGLLVCGGSDFHGVNRPGLSGLAVDVPASAWKEFRKSVLHGGGDTAGLRVKPKGGLPQSEPPAGKTKGFWVRILVPTVLAISLFLGALFLVLIPSFESRLLDRKRDMIRELTNVAFGVLAEYEAEADLGHLPPEEARKAAADRIRGLRYGDEGKDYFWITDLHPRMIMHPYRTDLDGQDLTQFKDPRGVRIFVEFVRALKDRPDALMEYVWQWKDDPERLAPKESYIKKFEPWGWILGTGLYIEDVRREIRTVAARLIRISAGISALCILLLAFVAGQSLRAERRRLVAEEDLRNSHEKYRALSESSTEGTLLLLDNRPAFANARMLEMLGYTEGELGLLDLTDLFPEELSVRLDGVPVTAALGDGWTGNLETETIIQARNGRTIKVGLTVSRVVLGGRDGYVLAVRDISRAGGPGGDPRGREFERDNLLGELQASLLFLREPVGPISVKPVFCDIQESITGAAALMSVAGAGAVVITAGETPVGLVTDRDIRSRVVAVARSSDRPVMEVMSAPLISLDESALVYEAILAMRENNIDQILVRDEAGRVTGILRNRDLLLFHRFSPAVLTAEIKRSQTPEDIARARKDLPPLVKTLVQGGAKARHITRAVTAVTDAATERLLDLAIEKLGPPPAAYAFLALGSQGREEQTLFTDQDHAIVFEDVPEAEVASVQEYFLALGRNVAAGLQAAGIPLCPGNIMAENPKWVQPLRRWKEYFESWLRTSEPQDLLDIQIFFDFRRLAGEISYSGEIRRYIREVLAEEPPFLLHFAQYTLQYKTPVSFFGHLVPDATAEGARAFNLKDALMPVVNFARLYAVRAGLQETNTLDRLRALAEIGEIKRSLHEDAVRVYDFLMQLRLDHQAALIGQGLEPDNNLDPRTLTPMEETLLKQSFAQISNIQKKISYDFLGSA
ncbi:MAG: cache domain-containing protein [Candidatus Aminicenantes bacterium]|nr:cache domain-containing protein [Candidatus Aminicenantes bacterium]